MCICMRWLSIAMHDQAFRIRPILFCCWLITGDCSETGDGQSAKEEREDYDGRILRQLYLSSLGSRLEILFPRTCQYSTQDSITSLGEQRMLTALGLPSSERSLIEGLKFKRSSGDSLNERQLANRAIVRLASNPPPEVGSLQRRTRGWLLRPYRVSREVRTSVASPLTDSNSRVSPQLLAFDSLAIT
jgi:hypothetical protein